MHKVEQPSYLKSGNNPALNLHDYQVNTFMANARISTFMCGSGRDIYFRIMIRSWLRIMCHRRVNFSDPCRTNNVTRSLEIMTTLLLSTK